VKSRLILTFDTSLKKALEHESAKERGKTGEKAKRHT
jgi:hypothetical protein